MNGSIYEDFEGFVREGIPEALQHKLPASHPTSILDPTRQAIVGRFMEEFWALFSQDWSDNITERTGNFHRPPRGATGHLDSSEASPPSHTSCRKRKRDQDEKQSSDDDSDRRRRRPTRRWQHLRVQSMISVSPARLISMTPVHTEFTAIASVH